MKQAKVIAFCGMMAALSFVLMLVGAVLELGMYAAPMLAGLCLLPVGEKYGKKYQVLLWIAVSLLSLILLPNLEESLVYLMLFGCYPVIRPAFQKLPKLLRRGAKLLYFNAVTLAVEWLVLHLLAPEAMTPAMAAVLLTLGNLTFFCYDLVIPRAQKKLGALVLNL